MKNENTPDWLKLDNAAKIFPSNSNKRDTKVFRLACELFYDVDGEVLQKALLKTIDNFPVYKSILKKGLFWYYLETRDIIPEVSEENLPVCYPIYNKKKSSLLFRVSYYKKRINLEIYHALADGTGGLEFLRSLIANYLLLKYPDKFKGEKINLNFNASVFEKIDDSFSKYYDNRGKKKKTKIERAYLLKGAKHGEQRLEVIEGIMNTKDVISLAKSYNTTVTVFITAVFLRAISLNMSTREKKKPVVVTIPVNLRQYFKSFSTRNFFGIFNAPYGFRKYSNDLEDIIKYLDNYFKEKLGYEQMGEIINSYVSLEENLLVRAIPLFIKNFGLWAASKFAEKKNTAALSNLGKIEMPKEFSEYIKLFDVFFATNKIQICMNSYQDNMVISFTSPFINTNIQKNFFDILTSLGIKVTIISNMNLVGE